MFTVFANGPGDLGSNTGRVIPKTKKWYLMPPCLTLSIIRYESRIKWCRKYRKWSLRVTLDYGRKLYLLIGI